MKELLSMVALLIIVFAPLLALTIGKASALLGQVDDYRRPKPKSERTRPQAHPDWMWEAQYHG